MTARPDTGGIRPQGPIAPSSDERQREPVSLAARRYGQVVAAAKAFLAGARSFGGNPPPLPAPPGALPESPEAGAAQGQESA